MYASVYVCVCERVTIATIIIKSVSEHFVLASMLGRIDKQQLIVICDINEIKQLIVYL